jgi:hypothetical protein
LDIVQQNPGKPWNYFGLSSNPNITWEIVQQNPGIPWNYIYLSFNPNITWEIVHHNPDKPWDYTILSENSMIKAKENFIRKELSECFKKSELKEELMATIWHPKNFDKFRYLDPDLFEEFI